jgi:hypothetical protein
LFADSLFQLEHDFLLRLAIWAHISVLAGALLLLWLTRRSERSPRDLAGATRLDHLLWLAVGLDLGGVAVGVTLAASGWYAGRRLGLVGAGLGIIVQAAAFLVLDGRLLAQLQGLV